MMLSTRQGSGVEIDALFDPFRSWFVAVKIYAKADRKKPESSEPLITNGEFVKGLMNKRIGIVEIESLVNDTNIPSAIGIGRRRAAFDECVRST